MNSSYNVPGTLGKVRTTGLVVREPGEPQTETIRLWMRSQAHLIPEFLNSRLCWHVKPPTKRAPIFFFVDWRVTWMWMTKRERDRVWLSLTELSFGPACIGL